MIARNILTNLFKLKLSQNMMLDFMKILLNLYSYESENKFRFLQKLLKSKNSLGVPISRFWYFYCKSNLPFRLLLDHQRSRLQSGKAHNRYVWVPPGPKRLIVLTENREPKKMFIFCSRTWKQTNKQQYCCQTLP